MRKISNFRKIMEKEDPRSIPAGEISKKPSGKNIEIEGDQKLPEETPRNNDQQRKEAAKLGAEGTIDKGARSKAHAFRYIGTDGDGIVFTKEMDEEKMESDKWQYLGEFSFPGGFLNQLPRNDKNTQWRIVHKN